MNGWGKLYLSDCAVVGSGHEKHTMCTMQEEQRRLEALRPPPEPRESALNISGEEAFLRRGR
eukprot:scaffold391427_cov37-Prasinocladus_malaysianus.AAC.1